MLVRCMKESPELRLHSEKIEIVAADSIARNIPHCVTPAQCAIRICVNRSHSAEGGVASPEVLKRRIRCSQQSPDHPLLVANLIQALRVAYIERVQQNGIQYAKDDDVCRNPQHQSK